MSKNLFKKGLAFGAVLALGVSGFTSVTAASAATGDVTIAPSAGTKYGAFSTDGFTLKSTVATTLSATNFAYKISNPDQVKLYIKVGGLTAATGATADSTITVSGRTSIGVAADMDTATGGTQATVALAAVADGTTGSFGTDAESEKYGEFEIDMKTLGITTLSIYGIASASATNYITVQPVEGTITNSLAVRTQTDGDSGPIGAGDALDYGDGDASISVQSWVESEATADYTTVDAANASAEQTVTWYDPKSTSVIPRIERFVTSAAVNLNDVTSNGNLAGSIEFTKPVNLDQVNLANWKSGIDVNGTAGTTSVLTGDDVKLSGYTSHDAVGRIYVKVDNNGSNITLSVSNTYALSVVSTGTAAPVFSSVAYTPTKVTTTATQIQATVTDSDNAIQTSKDDLAVQLRTGTKAFTYKAQILSADETALEAASVPVIAIVKAGSYLATGGGYTVSGALNTISKTSGVALSSGYTDAKGQYSVTVTSTNAATSEGYTVTFYVLKDNDTWAKVLDAGDSSNADYVATYEAAAATTLEPDSTVLAGSTVTAKFTVKDQFGKATAVNGTKALSIELQAANSTNLDKDAVVAADGTASFTFTNYVTSGSSDVLTAKVYTGSASVPTFLGGALTKTLSLYNPGAASAVNAPATLSTTITYDDFITGTANTTTNVAPNDGSVALTGTVVDANGTGIPGAVVTIAGKGLQLQKSGGTDYYLDTITVAADAAGAYNVNVFAHAVNTTGSNITITAGGKTATTVLKTYFPSSLVNGNNLVFSWKLPALLVKNTTYAVTAKLTDKWGNAVATTKNTADAVSFQGTGSVEVNSVSTAVTKNFDKTGSVTVFVRSVKDIAGPGSVTATLNAGSYYKATSSATDTALVVTEITTNDTATKWDETVFKNSLESNIEILEKKPTASISKGAKSSTVVVKNANGTTVKVVRGTKSVTKVATSNSQKVTLKGGTGKVTVYVNGVLVASK